MPPCAVPATTILPSAWTATVSPVSSPPTFVRTLPSPPNVRSSQPVETAAAAGGTRVESIASASAPTVAVRNEILIRSNPLEQAGGHTAAETIGPSVARRVLLVDATTPETGRSLQVRLPR